MRTHGVVKNASLYTASIVAQKIIALGFFWYVANALQPEAMGRYTFALAFTALFSFLTDLGLNPVLIREIAKRPDAAKKLLGITLTLKTVLVGICYAVIAVAAWLGESSSEVRWLILLAAIVTALDAWTVSLWGTLRGLQNLAYESIGAILVQIGILLFGSTALVVGMGTFGLMLALVISSLLHLAYAIMSVRRLLGFLPLPVADGPEIRNMLRLVPAFAMSGVFVRVYNNADVVLLGNIAGKTEVGLYAIPAKVTTALQQLIPVSLSAALFPSFSATYRTDRTRAAHSFTNAFIFLLLVAAPIGLGLALAAPWLVSAIWPNYTAVVPSFQLMALTIPCLFLAYPTGYFLNACDGQRWNMSNRGIMTTISIIANLVLIPTYGVWGAAIAFLLANLVLLVLDVHAVTRFIQLPVAKLLGDLLKVLLATAGMAITYLVLLPQLTGPGAAVAAAVVYALLALIFGLVRPSQVRRVTQAMRTN